MNYDEFIESILNSRENIKFGGSECHHIVPRCLGGEWDDGYIYLTPLEHLEAHRLLIEKYPGNRKLIYAYWRMCNGKYDIDPAEYSAARELFISMKKSLVMPDDQRKRISMELKGRVFTKEHRYKLSIANKGKSLPLEQREKISKSRIGKYKGEDNPFYGRHHTEESKEKMRLSRGDISGENNPMYGRNHSDASRRKISESKAGKCTGEDNPMYGKKHSDETRDKIRKSSSGRAWITSPTGEILRVKKESLDDYISQGYIRGRKSHPRE